MTTPIPYDPAEIDLAKRLACAAISSHLDISYRSYWDTYIKPKEGDPAAWPVGTGTAWMELARFVQKHILGQTLNRLLGNTSAPLDPALQVRLLELSSTLPDEDLQLAISFFGGAGRALSGGARGQTITVGWHFRCRKP